MWPFKNVISEGVRLLAEQMVKNPKDWKQESYHFSCISNPDIAFWTANGATHLHLEGNDGLNLAEKVFLNNAIKKSLALKVKMSMAANV